MLRALHHSGCTMAGGVAYAGTAPLLGSTNCFCCCCCCTPCMNRAGGGGGATRTAALHPRQPPPTESASLWCGPARPGRGPGRWLLSECATPALFLFARSRDPVAAFSGVLIDFLVGAIFSLVGPLVRGSEFCFIKSCEECAPDVRLGDADFRFGRCRRYIRDSYCSIKLQSPECFYLKFMSSYFRSDGIFFLFYWESRI